VLSGQNRDLVRLKWVLIGDWNQSGRGEIGRLRKRAGGKAVPAVLHGQGLYGEEKAARGGRWRRALRVTTEFLLSAVAATQFPQVGAPEIAFLGRSNVGKSSLLNALVGEKAARVSQTPGRTRAINFFLVADEGSKRKFVFADLPGYGYAKISKSISAEWPKFIEPYLVLRAALRLCVCLIDANVPAQPRDAQLLAWLQAEGRAFLVVATKVDKLSGNERTRNLAALKSGLAVEEIVPVSAKTGYGMKELWGKIAEAGNEKSGD
jgi:GTP-binding protein